MNRNPSGIEIAALIIGIVLSVRSRRFSNSGISTAGLVCSIIGCVFGAMNLLLAFILVLFAVAL